MPSQITHLAIAKRYLAKHPGQIQDVQRFLDGNVLPDLADDKAVAHCGIRSEFNDVVKRNREKVNPEQYRATHDLRDDLCKGWYLHLCVDDQYYNVWLKNYFLQSDMRQSLLDLYETSRRDDLYLVQHDGVAYSDTSYVAALEAINNAWDREHHARFGYGYQYVMPYDVAALDAFIEQMSDWSI